MQFEKIAIDKLKAADYNPRKKLVAGDPEFEKLKNSILEFGYVEPVIFNKRTGVVVGGHQRLEVLRHLGNTEVDCVVVDIDEQKEKALNIALNKISGAWDDALLTNLLKDLSGSGFDIGLTGFDGDEIDKLFKGTIQDVKEDDFDAEQAAAQITQPCTTTGDLWHIGRHKVLCGDSTSESDVGRLFGNQRADLIVTDPPYNIDYGNADADRREARGHAAKDRTILNDKMSDANFYKFLLDFYKAAFGIIKGGGAFYVFHSSKEGVNFTQACKAAGFKISQTLMWIKNRFTLGRNDYQWQHEPILYGWKVEDGKPHYFIYDRTQSAVFDDQASISKLKKEELVKIVEEMMSKIPSDVIREDKPTRSTEHPTMKPIVLCARLINNSSREREIVYDAFGGSGSTLMAAAQLNRTSYNIELDPKFCDVIIKRYVKTFGSEGIFVERDGQKIPLGKFKELCD